MWSGASARAPDWPARIPSWNYRSRKRRRREVVVGHRRSPSAVRSLEPMAGPATRRHARRPASPATGGKRRSRRRRRQRGGRSADLAPRAEGSEFPHAASASHRAPRFEAPAPRGDHEITEEPAPLECDPVGVSPGVHVSPRTTGTARPALCRLSRDSRPDSAHQRTENRSSRERARPALAGTLLPLIRPAVRSLDVVTRSPWAYQCAKLLRNKRMRKWQLARPRVTRPSP